MTDFSQPYKCMLLVTPISICEGVCLCVLSVSRLICIQLLILVLVKRGVPAPGELAVSIRVCVHAFGVSDGVY